MSCSDKDSPWNNTLRDGAPKKEDVDASLLVLASDCRGVARKVYYERVAKFPALYPWWIHLPPLPNPPPPKE